MSKIILKFKEAVLKEIPLNKEIITIGRNPDNDIHIDNPAVSSFHAKLISEGGTVFIEDQDSTNGTFVNGKTIAKLSLNNNDVVTIGRHTLVFSSPPVSAYDADTTVKKKAAMDETIVIDAAKQKALLEKAHGVVEITGGFTVIEGTADKTEYELTGRLTTIGKDESAGIKLKGFFAPKIAALVNRTKTGYFISPSESGKKVKINGSHIEGRYELKDGDIVEAGNIKMQFYIKE